VHDVAGARRALVLAGAFARDGRNPAGPAA